MLSIDIWEYFRTSQIGLCEICVSLNLQKKEPIEIIKQI